jgi:hypothetical protein
MSIGTAWIVNTMTMAAKTAKAAISNSCVRPNMASISFPKRRVSPRLLGWSDSLNEGLLLVEGSPQRAADTQRACAGVIQRRNRGTSPPSRFEPWAAWVTARLIAALERFLQRRFYLYPGAFLRIPCTCMLMSMMIPFNFHMRPDQHAALQNSAHEQGVAMGVKPASKCFTHHVAKGGGIDVR